MNNVNLIGTIGKDIELKYLPSGSAVASFSIAINQDYMKDGQKVKKTSWIDCSVFGKRAETINQYFNKGSRIGITGELDQQTWTDNQGQNKSKIIVKVNSFDFIDKKSDNHQPQGQNYNQPYQGGYNHSGNGMNQPTKQEINQYQDQLPQIDLDEDEIPFQEYHMDQKTRVLKHLQQTGEINPLIAWIDLGVYRLSDVIYKLRADGYEIKTVKTTSYNKFNEKVKFATYVLEK